MVTPKKHRTVVQNTYPCSICKVRPFQYTCPRCNLRYCSLPCYKDKSHAQCTESFYKDAVMEELKSSPGTTSNDRKQMLGILDRFERQAVDQEQLLNMTEDEILQHHILQQQEDKKSAGIVSSSSSGASSTGEQTTGAKPARRKLTPKERDELIQKAIEQEQLEQKNSSGDMMDQNEEEAMREEEIEKALEQEYQDFVNRFAGVDLDQESFDSIWARLNPDEQQEFRERFMINGKPDDDADIESILRKSQATDDNNLSDNDDEDEEEQGARLLMKEMEDVMKRGKQGRQGSDGDSSKAILADLDTEDLKALRDAEISELITIWKPWWEVEAEEAGQLKKVIVSEVTPSDDGKDPEGRLTAAAVALGQPLNSPENIPENTSAGASTATSVQERLVLDEEAMLRPHRSLIQALDDGPRPEERTKQLSPMTRPPHPTLIYHICGLLLAFAATSRVLNGDLLEEPEQSLTYMFELCPFFAPPPASPGASKKPAGVSIVRSPPNVPEVDDFETTLAVLQQSSLNSKLWKGDTLRLEMLSLLLRDLTLLLAHPARCLKGVHELEAIFDRCLKDIESDAVKGWRLYSKSTLIRLLKKLEFYASYLQSNEWLLKTDRLDQVRTEVVMAGIRVRQEMKGWAQEIEQVSRVVPVQPDTATQAGESKVLIEVLE